MDLLQQTVKLLPKQYQFVKSNSPEILFTGSYGSGKSVSLCYKLLTHAIIPRNLVLLCRKSRSSLIQSTLRTLITGDGNMQPILPQGSYEHLSYRSEIKINGGGTIIYTGVEDELKIRSMNLGAIFLDEAVETTLDEYLALIGRLRNTADKNHQLCSATNPSSQNHYLYKRFFMENNKDREHITATIDDNKHLPESYVKSIKEYTGVNLKRYAYGDWCNNEGAVYKEFNTDLHIKEKEFSEYTQFIISLDIGFTDPTAILVTGYNDNNLHIFEELGTNTLTPTDIADKIKELQQTYRNNKVVIDKSAKGTITQCESMGIQVNISNSDIEGGILRVKELLTKNNITISNKCKGLIKELDMYSYKDGTDKPEDKNNHFCDSLRYMTNLYYDAKGHIISPNVYFVGNDDNKIEIESEAQRMNRIFCDDD